MKHRPIRYQREREYPMSVEEAWALLADTNHLNRSIGLPAVEFSPIDGSRSQYVRKARARAFKVLPMRWKEYPFDWVRERRYAVRREFEWGPIATLIGSIELEPAGDAVKVKAAAEFTPRNLLGRFLWRAASGSVDDMLAFCDDYLLRKGAGKIDPVPVPAARSPVDKAQLDRLMERLAKTPVRQELLAPLRERIVEGSDDQVLGMRAYAVADTWGADRLEVLRLFLHATRTGLLELRWELMCPNCRIPKAETDTLAQLPGRFHCETCGISYTTDFDQRVELRFSVHQAIRKAVDNVYCIGGPLRMPHVFAQQYLAPHESRRLDVDLGEPLRLRAVGGTRHLSVVPDLRRSGQSEVRVTYAGGRWTAPHSLVASEADVLALPEEAAISLQNQTEGPLLAVLEQLEWAGDATTAAQVTTLQEFRDLFSSEVLAPGQQLAVQDIALLFSDLRGSTRLYEGVGDATAYSRVSRHFDFTRDRIAAHQGSTVKTMGDGVMGAFYRLEDALAAAIEMQRDISDWCATQEIEPALVLKIGIHHGPVIAMNANDRLDYFGRTANVAARLGAQSQGGDIVLLKQVYEEALSASIPAVADIPVESFSAHLRGVEGERELARLTVAPNR